MNQRQANGLTCERYAKSRFSLGSLAFGKAEIRFNQRPEVRVCSPGRVARAGATQRAFTDDFFVAFIDTHAGDTLGTLGTVSSAFRFQ